MQEKLWSDVLAKLEKRINRPSFNTWIRPTRCLSIVQPQVQIGVPDDVFVYWLGEHYVNVITDILVERLGFQPEISFVVMEAESNVGETENASENIALAQNASLAQAYEPQAAAPSTFPATRNDDSFTSTQHGAETGKFEKKAERFPDRSRIPVPSHASLSYSLNRGYTFDSYVVGNNNHLAHAAALAVAEQKAINYNPLFIYGGVGLGKTHLLHAIGNHIARLSPRSRILYLSAEQFINDLVGSIREDRMTAFREKYRAIDVLLIDDIQFIARKERTQEEFFHTFNTLYQAEKQIVLTSDCPPKKIATIAEQLRSRFEWGLIADIQPPDFETRIAILKKKADIHNIILCDDVAVHIATKVKSNIRELEGCLSKIRAYSTFTNQMITLNFARKVLRDLFDDFPKKVTIELVQQVVANHYHVELNSMKSSGRTRSVTLPRQIAMYLARELTHLSLPDIGKNFGGRDHTTVRYACKTIERIQNDDRDLKEHILQIRSLIQA